MKRRARKWLRLITVIVVTLLFFATIAQAQLPPEDAPFQFEGQTWPVQPGTRVVSAHVYYPGGRLINTNANTCLMLSLHNWGGQGYDGAPNPIIMANVLNCVVITVNYLQSGSAAFGPAPYDHGLYQAVDALRALHVVFKTMRTTGRPFDTMRIYATGGSGGGNVALMAHRLAPRTFAAVVVMSAPIMPKFAPPLDSRWGALPPNEFRIRDLSDGPLGAITRSLSRGTVRLVHGFDDPVVPYNDAVAASNALGASLLTVMPWGLWGPYQDAGHSIGNRTAIALQDFQLPLFYLRRTTFTDFELRDNAVRYPVVGGVWGMNYNGTPTLTWGW